MISELLSLLGLGAALFATTNIDDVFVLLGFFSDPKFKARQVAIGQYLGIAALFGVSVVASLISLVVPAAYIGLLGFAPIAIGLKKVWDLRHDATLDAEQPDLGKGGTGGRGNILTVAAVTIANGGDNISIYTPLFATRSGYDIGTIGAVFAVMTAAWLLVAHRLTTHPTIGAPIRRYGHRVVPFVLIGLGLYILYEAGTVTLLRS